MVLQSTLQGVSGVPSASSYEITFVSGAAVWPGDTNDDGVVDERDILPIGRYFGNVGPGRETTGIIWDRCLAPALGVNAAWQPYRAVYADADGSGAVGATDICAVADNWLRVATVLATEFAEPESEPALKQLDAPLLQALYQAAVECPESRGQSALLDILRKQLQPVDNPLPDQYTLLRFMANLDRG